MLYKKRKVRTHTLNAKLFACARSQPSFGTHIQKHTSTALPSVSPTSMSYATTSEHNYEHVRAREQAMARAFHPVQLLTNRLCCCWCQANRNGSTTRHKHRRMIAACIHCDCSDSCRSDTIWCRCSEEFAIAFSLGIFCLLHCRVITS